MKILVTGGAGFIGSHVANAYLDCGHEVVVLDNLSSGRLENVPRNARFVEMDLNSSDLGRFIAYERFEVINHHAAQISVPGSVDDPKYDAQINVIGLINLLQASCKNGLEKIIFVSSGGAVYGEMDTPPFNEEKKTRPMSPYAITKRAGELYLDYYSQQFGVTAVTLRYSNVFGPRQIPHGEAGVVSIFMDKLIENQSPTIFRSSEMPNGMHRDYIYVTDCARANLLALNGEQGIYNIGTGIETDTLSLWEAIKDTAGIQVSHQFGPSRAGDIKRSALDCKKATEKLGWQPKYDLRRGLAETWAWRVGY